LIKPCTAGDLKKNLFGMLKDRPCKIVEVRTSKTGKHGHAKCSMTGIDVLTGKKIQDVQPAHAQMYFAEVQKRELQVLFIDEHSVSCLDENSVECAFNLDGCTCTEELRAAYDAGDEDNDIYVQVLSAPEMVGAEIARKEVVAGFRKSNEAMK